MQTPIRYANPGNDRSIAHILYLDNIKTMGGQNYCVTTLDQLKTAMQEFGTTAVMFRAGWMPRKSVPAAELTQKHWDCYLSGKKYR